MFNHLRAANGKFQVWGNDFDTLAEVARHYSIPEKVISQQCTNNRATLEDNVGFIFDKTIFYQGSQYSSLRSLAEENGIPYQNVQRALMQGKTFEAAINGNKTTKMIGSDSVTFRGQTYSSKVALLEHYNLTKHVVDSILTKHNISSAYWLQAFTLAITFLETLGVRPNSATRIPYVIYNGVWYNTKEDFCMACNVEPTALTRVAVNNPDSAPLALMFALSSLLVARYNYNGRLYESSEIQDMLGKRPTELIKQGIIQRVNIPKYPQCTFHPVLYSRDVQKEYTAYLTEKLREMNIRTGN